MSEKEYIVSLNRGVDYAAFNQEMIAATGAGAPPLSKLLLFRLRMVFYDGDPSRPLYTMRTLKL